MRVFVGMKGGPVHLAQDGGRLSWCGAKKQFRHIERDGTADDVTCPKCLRQIRQDRPLSWKGR